MTRTQKKGLIIGILVFLLLLGAYIGVGLYFQSHFFPNTVINGYDSSLKTADAVTKHNISIGNSYLLTIYDRLGVKHHLRGMDFGYAYENLGEEKALLDSQNSFAWPMELTASHEYTLNASCNYDSSALQKEIFKLTLFDEDVITPPTDASIVRNESGIYEVSASDPGNSPIEERVAAEITAAVEAGIPECTLSDDCYQTPKITEDSPEIAKTMEQIKSYQASTIHYEIDGADENLTAEMIADMIRIGKKNSVSIDQKKVEDFVQHLATTYNTYGDVRTFKTSKGDKIEIGGGDYGWVIHKAREKEQILDDLSGGKPISREPVYEQTARKSGIKDIGKTYVELDYTNQHLYYYEKGKKILESDFVSGNISRGNGSPDGIFKIVYKQSPATLVGETYQSDVTYFMPFAYNVGIHDASWRNGKFGGQIYKTSGSHGCVNVPLETAEQLYDLLEVGTPVVAYYREKVKLTSESNRIANAYSYVDTGKKNHH